MEAQPQKKRKLCSYSGPDPTVEEIEAEFWRIVESPDEVRLLLLCPCSHYSRMAFRRA